jgi:Zn-dependent protease with chaperone function
MYDQQIILMKQKVDKLARQAKLRKIPKLKISRKEPIAHASFLRKEITIGTKLLAQWQEGKIDETDVEATLAHEIGHLMDYERGARSIYVQSIIVLSLYLFFGAFLFMQWFLPLSLFLLWIMFLTWIVKRSSIAVQFKADKNATKLINDQQLANSILKRSLLRWKKEEDWVSSKLGSH